MECTSRIQAVCGTAVGTESPDLLVGHEQQAKPCEAGRTEDDEQRAGALRRQEGGEHAEDDDQPDEVSHASRPVALAPGAAVVLVPVIEGSVSRWPDG